MDVCTYNDLRRYIHHAGTIIMYTSYPHSGLKHMNGELKEPELMLIKGLSGVPKMDLSRASVDLCNVYIRLCIYIYRYVYMCVCLFISLCIYIYIHTRILYSMAENRARRDAND